MNAKEKKYEELLPQVAALIEGEDDRVSVMANVASALHHAMGFFWTGFYVVSGDELRLGPFQGTVACMHIARGRGVCGTAWEREETIVVPVRDAAGKVCAVLDIDSRELGTFDDTDRLCLEQLVGLLRF